LILLFFKINYLLAGIPGAYFNLPQIPLGAVLVYYAVLAFLFFAVPFAKKRWVR